VMIDHGARWYNTDVCASKAAVQTRLYSLSYK
jgi:hypothetical protein